MSELFPEPSGKEEKVKERKERRCDKKRRKKMLSICSEPGSRCETLHPECSLTFQQPHTHDVLSPAFEETEAQGSGVIYPTAKWGD